VCPLATAMGSDAAHRLLVLGAVIIGLRRAPAGAARWTYQDPLPQRSTKLFRNWRQRVTAVGGPPQSPSSASDAVCGGDRRQDPLHHLRNLSSRGHFFQKAGIKMARKV